MIGNNEVPDDGQDTPPAPGPVTTTVARQEDRPSIEGIAFEGTNKRTAKTARRHARRDDKRQRAENDATYRDLCILDGHNNATYGGEVNLLGLYPSAYARSPGANLVGGTR